MKVVFLIAACASVLAVFLICVFLFANGLPAMGKIGPLKFLFGTEWRTTNDKFGILPMIVASIYVTAGAILIGVPIALFTSVFMARYCPKKIYKPLKSGIELMAGVPSIVYGYFGLVLLVPLIRQLFGGTGSSMLAACILLGIMILPTIIGVTESAVRSVPESYYEGSLALGATKERSIFFVMLPAAKSGILAGCPYHDCKHRNRDGICIRTSQRSTDRNRSCTLCIYPDHQLKSFTAEQEGGVCKLTYL